MNGESHGSTIDFIDPYDALVDAGLVYPGGARPQQRKLPTKKKERKVGIFRVLWWIFLMFLIVLGDAMKWTGEVIGNFARSLNEKG